MKPIVRHLSIPMLVFALFAQTIAAKSAGAWENRTRYTRFAEESARQIPVAYDVDVVVVGGSSGAVAAAVAAAGQGAKVFLAAERPYLGEDICGTYRLWLEPGETPTRPLARKVFAAQRAPTMVKGLDFEYEYEADIPSAAQHKDTSKPSLLNDGKWHNAASQSVQYDGDVVVTADLGRQRQLKSVHVMAYQRREGAVGNDFEVDSVVVSVSEDGQQWKRAAVIKNLRAGESLPEPWGPIDLSADLNEQARYVRFGVKKSADVNRVLLGEIIIEDSQSAERAGPGDRAMVAVTPMHVKRVLDEALLEASVRFLYGCYATDLLVDDNDGVAGIVMANRSGRQAVLAKVVIDATPRAEVARMAGASFQPYPQGAHTFKRIVVWSQMRSEKDIVAKELPVLLPVAEGRGLKVAEYTLKIPMVDGSLASFARAEQIARDKTWEPSQVDASEVLFHVPPDQMKGKTSLSIAWPGAENVNLDVFRPADIGRLFVLGGCADVPRNATEKILRPVELMAIGERVGKAAGLEAKQLPKAGHVRVLSERTGRIVSAGDTKENLSPIRSTADARRSVASAARTVPVLGEYDVVVVGGGTGGAPAGISSARKGAKTLVIEYLHGLGGVGTTGYISKYYYGYIEGFTKEIDAGVAALGGAAGQAGTWNIEWKKEWYRRQLRNAGAEIWFGVLGCGAYVDDGRVKGVVVATPQGRGVVLAKAVIDATGNSDIAAAAGAQCEYTNGSGVAVQGAGLPGVKIDAGYTNTDWAFIDDGDVVDVWQALVVAKDKFSDAYDLGQLIDTRERRRIVGEFTMSPMDILLGRTYPDTITVARSNFDSHGFTVHPLFMIRPPDRATVLVNVPYRCLLPRGLEGILVTGLGVSAHRDAMPVIRMQPDIQNQGYAAGIAAAMSAQSGKSLGRIGVRTLQKHLVKKGNLPKAVLTDKDSLPLPKAKVADAVNRLANKYDGLEIVLAQLDDSLPMLRQAYAESTEPSAKLIYAHVLGMLGEATGIETLLQAVESGQWDKGWNYTGMGQFGMSLSPLDSLIVALGRTRDKRAVKVIIEKTGQLDSKSEFSHCRAIAMAIEALGDRDAAQSLAELLKKPGMMGHAFTDIAAARQQTPRSPTDTSTRNASLKELFLARALYRCGDYEGLGRKILEDYTGDLRAHYARHAGGVLDGSGEMSR
jgi:flavin-dependent dehydrogenase